MATVCLRWTPWPATTRVLRQTVLALRLRGYLTATLPLVSLCSGCGGGATPSSAQVTVSPADFSLQLSSSSLTLPQGTTSSTVSISVTAQNGFNGIVQVALSGLPSGVASNPASPFSLAVGANTSLIFGANSNAATGTFTITAMGSSGSLSHSATLILTINPGIASNLPRTDYTRTDAQPAL